MRCKFVLSIPLPRLFNQSLSTGVFSGKWKISYISPFFKDWIINHVINYHSIPIKSIIPKVFEITRIICENVFSRFKNMITDEQHGFMSGKSATDFTKAFDKIYLIHLVQNSNIWVYTIIFYYYAWNLTF